MLALVNRAAEQIERALFEAQFRDFEQMHFHSDPYLVGSSHEGLLAFEGDRLVGANRNGVKLLGLDWPARGAPALRRAVHPRARRGQSKSRLGRLRSSDEEGQASLCAHASAAAPAPRLVAGAGRRRADVFADGEAGGLTLPQIMDRLLSGPFARLLTVRRVKAGQIIYGADEEKAAAGRPGHRAQRPAAVLRLGRRQGADAVHPRRRRRAAAHAKLDVRGQEGRRDRRHERQGVSGDRAMPTPTSRARRCPRSAACCSSRRG